MPGGAAKGGAVAAGGRLTAACGGSAPAGAREPAAQQRAAAAADPAASSLHRLSVLPKLLYVNPAVEALALQALWVALHGWTLSDVWPAAGARHGGEHHCRIGFIAAPTPSSCAHRAHPCLRPCCSHSRRRPPKPFAQFCSPCVFCWPWLRWASFWCFLGEPAVRRRRVKSRGKGASRSQSKRAARARPTSWRMVSDRATSLAGAFTVHT